MSAEPQLTQQATALLKNVALKLSDAAWSVSHSLKRISDYVQGHAALSSSRAWLVGVQYGSVSADGSTLTLTPEDMERLIADFRSRVWCTYRREFPPIAGYPRLTSDVHWGCTIRSGQMMMAELLSRSRLSRGWRRVEGQPCEQQDTLFELLDHFADHSQAALSIHRICEYGQPHGIVPGTWLGPWVLCKSLAALVNATPQLGLRVHVVCDPGGGAPTLHVEELHRLLGRSAQHTQHERASAAEPEAAAQVAETAAAAQPEQLVLPATEADSAAAAGQLQAVDTAAEGAGDIQTGHNHTNTQGVQSTQAITGTAPAAGPEQPSVLQPDSEAEHQASLDAHTQPQSRPATPPPAAPAAGGAAAAEAGAAEPAAQQPLALSDHDSPAVPAQGPHTRVSIETVVQPVGGPQAALASDGPAEPAQAPCEGLVLLLPLTLGVGRANPVYYPQLLEMLTYPQSVGIVGGRPSASLYFVGLQDSNLLYLDPHIPQLAGPVQATLSTYFCNHVQLMPITHIDPSLAIGFLCTTTEELDDLIERLDKLAQSHRQAPLVTLAKPGEPSREGWQVQHRRRTSQDEESWEML